MSAEVWLHRTFRELPHLRVPRTFRSEKKSSSSETSGYRWFIKSKDPGSSNVTLTLPIELPQFPFSVTLLEDRTLVTELVAPAGATPSKIASRPPIPRRPVVLNKDRPIYSAGNLELDVQRMKLTYRLEFETTLGVSAKTYSVLTVVGTILAAFLGSGILWKICAVADKGWGRLKRARRATTGVRQ